MLFFSVNLLAYNLIWVLFVCKNVEQMNETIICLS